MSDLLFISAAMFLLGFCFVSLIAFGIYSFFELQESNFPKWVKWVSTSVVVAFLVMIVAIALKITESL